MINKKILMFGMFLLIGIFLTSFVLGQVSYCCEKTIVKSDGSGGAWCVNAEQDECDNNFLSSPTACSSTSFCASGTCVNKKDGECMENTPKRSCEDASIGYWSIEDPENIPQCQLGCCLMGDQAAFVTQTKCKSFASLYSIDTHFQSNIQNEIQCIASAFPDAKGACVFEREFETTCKMTTRSECNSISDAEFHEGFLCTADELATDCSITKETTCVDGQDEVFFTDSCGNVLNVYDSSKISEVNGQAISAEGEENYWTYITAPDCTTGVGTTNNFASCGDCGYFEGSTCKEYNRNQDSVAPDYGNYICRDLGCGFDVNDDGDTEDEGETFLHGETWCVQAQGATFLDVTGGELLTTEIDSTKKSLPGSRYFRMVCYNGEVTVEPCEDNRAEVCIQSERDYTLEGVSKTFKSAVCRVNAWQDCVAQNSSEDCEDSSVRDCQWITETMGDGETLNKCVPLVAPGFVFWSDENEEEQSVEATAICSLASTSCTAHYEKSLADDLTSAGTKQIDGDECFDGGKDYVPAWGEAQNQYCVSLGDCQGKLSGDEGSSIIEIIKNYLGFN
jgi:hypothetical protein